MDNDHPGTLSQAGQKKDKICICGSRMGNTLPGTLVDPCPSVKSGGLAPEAFFGGHDAVCSTCGARMGNTLPGTLLDK